ncbi:hypothetical protein [Desulfonatronum parangueonense]
MKRMVLRVIAGRRSRGLGGICGRRFKQHAGMLGYWNYRKEILECWNINTKCWDKDIRNAGMKG